ncbi:hypothetical protein FACS1894127_2920 [Clostridia bacterium]|nr:hypothetical protein FACS1894127_2920 [Clostridia bacterium]
MGDEVMKDRFGREIRQPREFKVVPEYKVDKKITRLITILLFLIAAILFLFPSGDEENPPYIPEQQAVSPVSGGGVMLSPMENLPDDANISD